jgi:phenylalanyl-tRNA synthetase beta chain
VSTRDLAVVVADHVPAAELVRVAAEAGAPLVRDVHVFDRYTGPPVPDGHVSLALRLELAAPERTLTDEEIDARVGHVVEALAARVGATRR